MRTHKETKPLFRVGDWVSLLYGPYTVLAQILEDRGPLGVKGRRLYRIRIDQEGTEPTFVEVPEEKLTAAGLPDRCAVLRYLKEGGLVAILQSHLVAGRDHPRAWLTYTRGGGLTHTLAPDRGVLGGGAVPYFALIETKVYAAKKREVLTFLMGLGLTEAEAEEVIQAVGTAP